MTCARILYENHRGDSKRFGLHTLLCALVDDALGKEGHYYAKGHIDGMPRSGNAKLLEDCKEDASRVFAAIPPRARFALVDADKLPEFLELPGSSSIAELRAHLEENFPLVTIVTPDPVPLGSGTIKTSNTEGLLRVLAQCAGWSADHPDLARALNKGRGALGARDSLFESVASAHHRAVRDCFLRHQPAIESMVKSLAAVVKAATGL